MVPSEAGFREIERKQTEYTNSKNKKKKKKPEKPTRRDKTCFIIGNFDSAMRYLRFEQLINGRAARTTKREWSTESQASCFTTKDMIIPSSKFNETGTILPHYLIRLRVEPGPDSRLSHAIVAVK